MDSDWSNSEWSDSDDQENPQDAQSTDESESEDDLDDLDDLENNDGDEIQRDLRNVHRENRFIGSQLINLQRENQRFKNMLRDMENGDRLRRRRVLEVGLIFYREEGDIYEGIAEQEEILNRYPAPPPQSGETPTPTTEELIHNTAQQNIDMLQQILLLRQDTDAIRSRIREFRSSQRLRF